MEKIIKCNCNTLATNICEICNKNICQNCVAPINNVLACFSCQKFVEWDEYNNATSVNGYYIHCNDLVYKDNNKILGCQNKECFFYKMYS